MNKKIASILLALVLCLAILPAGAETAAEWTGEVDHVIMTYLTLGVTPPDLQMVQDALNERTVKEIGVEVDIKPISAYDSISQFPTWISTGERIDLMFPILVSVKTYKDMGLIDPLDDLIVSSAPYIKKLTEEGYTFASNNTIDGQIWAVAQIPNTTQGSGGGGYHFANSALEGTDIVIDPKKVYTLDELGEMFAKIKAAHPELYPCGTVTTSGTQFGYLHYYDYLGSKDGTGLLNWDSEKIENIYASEAYHDYLVHMRDWYQAGYVYTDAATTDQTNVSLMTSGVTAGYFMSSVPATKDNPDMTIVRLSDPIVTSSEMGGWVIPMTAEEPEAAMRLLNLMYEDASIANLIQWGIEGAHYVVKDPETHLIGFPEGLDAGSSGYYNTLGLYGDMREVYVWDASVSQKELDAYSAEAEQKKGIAVGFHYFPTDAASVKITALTAVIQQYTPALEAGAVDVDSIYPQFLQALEAAGINDVAADKQAQLDTFLAK